jgi:Methyltransferase domain
MMREALRSLIPLGPRRAYTQWKKRRLEAGGNLFCPVCQSAVRSFLPHGNPLRAHVKCPVCDSKACHRLCWAYFKQNTQLFQSGGVFLHVAPEAELGRWLRRQCRLRGMQYKSGDIRDRRRPLNIEATGAPDASVDVLFACHVLNMVREDRKTLAEIARILKPGGLAVIPVPLLPLGVRMKEVGPGGTDCDRLATFNDPLMYRAYDAETYRARVQAAGLEMREYRSRDVRAGEATKWQLGDECVQVAEKDG